MHPRRRWVIALLSRQPWMSTMSSCGVRRSGRAPWTVDRDWSADERRTVSGPNHYPAPDEPRNGVTGGTDWARDDHAVSIVDARGRDVRRATIEHNAADCASCSSC